MKIERLIVWSCIAWIATVGTLIYAVGIWSAYERRITPTAPLGPGIISSRNTLRKVGASASDPPTTTGASRIWLWPVAFPSPARVAGSSEGRSQGVRSVPPPRTNYLSEAAAGPLRVLADRAAALCGVPPRLFRALISRESNWDPAAVSASGAVGLAQVKPSTARELDPGLDVRDPWQGLLAGACYLRIQYDRFGTWPAALHAYRLGPSAARSVIGTKYAADIMGSAR